MFISLFIAASLIITAANLIATEITAALISISICISNYYDTAGQVIAITI